MVPQRRTCGPEVPLDRSIKDAHITRETKEYINVCASTQPQTLACTESFMRGTPQGLSKTLLSGTGGTWALGPEA